MVAAVGIATLGVFGGGDVTITTQTSIVDDQINLREIIKFNLVNIEIPVNLKTVKTTNLQINVITNEDIVIVEPAT